MIKAVKQKGKMSVSRAVDSYEINNEVTTHQPIFDARCGIVQNTYRLRRKAEFYFQRLLEAYLKPP